MAMAAAGAEKALPQQRYVADSKAPTPNAPVPELPRTMMANFLSGSCHDASTNFATELFRVGGFPGHTVPSHADVQIVVTYSKDVLDPLLAECKTRDEVRAVLASSRNIKKNVSEVSACVFGEGVAVGIKDLNVTWPIPADRNTRVRPTDGRKFESGDFLVFSSTFANHAAGEEKTASDYAFTGKVIGFLVRVVLCPTSHKAVRSVLYALTTSSVGFRLQERHPHPPPPSASRMTRQNRPCRCCTRTTTPLTCRTTMLG